MKVLFAASEAVPFAKVGGLADVAGSLPQALKKAGEDIRVVIPMYSSIPKTLRDKARFLGSVNVPLAWRNQYCGIFESEYGGVLYYLLDNEFYFKRSGIYGQDDDIERYAFFSKAILEILPFIGFMPDIIHSNDWHTGLVPVFLKSLFSGLAGYMNIKTVFTIHNIQYQGWCSKSAVSEIMGLDASLSHILEYNGGFNIMKGAVEASDSVTTVSKTYAEEIKTPYFAYGLESILQRHSGKLKGIVNGIDTEVFNPETDQSLFVKYGIKTRQLKAFNKKSLQKLLGLPEEKDTPVMAMITRLTGHKGLDLVTCVINEIMSLTLQMVILGTGEKVFEDFFSSYSDRVGNSNFKAIIGFSPELAQKIYAGSDLFLMPSQSEPCGLSQMIALRYGTIPIVRETGGLKDTVAPYNPETKTGNGITFSTYNAHDMLNAIERARNLYLNREERRIIRRNAMQGDYSWDSKAKEYIGLYKPLSMISR